MEFKEAEDFFVVVASSFLEIRHLFIVQPNSGQSSHEMKA